MLGLGCDLQGNEDSGLVSGQRSNAQVIPSNFLQVDWDLTRSMLAFTAGQIHHSSPRVNISKGNLDRMTICGKV